MSVAGLCVVYIYIWLGLERGSGRANRKRCARTCSETSAIRTQTPGNYPKRNNLQDRQCTYNVTMRRVRATIVAVEKQ